MYRVYISSPVSEYQRQWNVVVSTILRRERFIVYLPQEITDIRDDHAVLELLVYEQCIEMMAARDFGLLLLPYGRDCAWEAGYYKGLNKPLFVFATDLTAKQKKLLRDWMVKGSIEDLFTTSLNTHAIFAADTILQHKRIHLLQNLEQLPEALEQAYEACLAHNHTTYLGVGAVVTKGDKVLLIQEDTASRYYIRKEGMWGYPTKLFNPAYTPEQQSLMSLKEETGLYGVNPTFMSQQAVPNAIGLFYRVDLAKGQTPKVGRWVDIQSVVDEKIYLRPTFANVLQALVKDRQRAGSAKREADLSFLY